MSVHPQQVNLKAYWSVLGHVPLLSLAELISFYGVSPEGFNYAKDCGAASFTAAVLEGDIAKLGGTIKLGQQLAENIAPDELLSTLSRYLPATDKKVVFGISIYGKSSASERSQLAEQLGKELKFALKTKGQSGRFVSNQREPFLNSASVTHNKLTTGENAEFLIFENADGYCLAKTIAVQPFEDFSKRDFGRPGRDDFSGMLPPKLALMMLNLAGVKTTSNLLDPFCGSGTILSEALQLGVNNLTGSDLSDKAIADTKQNLEWFGSNVLNLPATPTAKLFQADASDLTKKISKGSENAIVTEPYLGPPLKGNESPKQIQDIITELKTLYAAALNQFVEVLAPSGVVVMVVPRWFNHGKWHTLSQLLPIKNKKFGLQPEPLLPASLSADPFVLYHRPGQFVGREIWRLKKI